MLALAGDTMMWEGQVFPMVLCDGDQLPEAFHSEPGLLPHLHADHESRYPRAAVKHCLDDLDPPEDFGLEQRGIQLGKAPQRYTPLPSVKEKTDTFHGSLQSMNSLGGPMALPVVLCGRGSPLSSNASAEFFFKLFKSWACA